MVASPHPWVDLISNQLTIDLTFEGLEIDQEAVLTDDRLRIFLHEHTHFTSFGHSVAKALAFGFQYIEKLHRSEALAKVQERGPTHPLSRLLRNFRAAVIMFEGLAEGLALFAEWDALPGRSPTASPAMETTLALDKKSHRDDPWATLRKLIQDVRLDEGQDKIALLEQPIAGNQGYYLLGYLCIKALYRVALSRTPRFWDSDLFVLFVNRVVFDNAIWAAYIYLIEQPYDEWLERLQQLTELSMLSVLWSDDLDRRVQQFEEVLANEGVTPEDRAPVIASVMGGRLSDWELWQRHAVRALGLAMADAGEPTRRFSEYELREYFASLDRAREMLRIRHLRGNAVVAAGKVVFHDSDGKIVAETLVEHDVVGGDYANSAYSLYYLPRHGCYVRFVFFDQDGPQLLGWEVYRRPWAKGLPNIDLVRPYALSARAVEQRECDRDKLGGPPNLMVLADKLLTSDEKQAVKQAFLKIVARCLWGDIEPGKQSERLSMMNSQGIFGWLGKEHAVRKAALRSSLAASRDPDIASIEMAMADCDLTLSEWPAHIERIETALELPLYASFSSGSTQSLIFGF